MSLYYSYRGSFKRPPLKSCGEEMLGMCRTRRAGRQRTPMAILGVCAPRGWLSDLLEDLNIL